MSVVSPRSELNRAIAEHDTLRLCALSWWRVSLPLRLALHHASACESALESIIIAADFDGVTGLAEVRSNGSYATGETAEDIEMGFRSGSIIGLLLREATKAVITRSKLAAMALDMAAWDALGKRRGEPLYIILGGSETKELVTHAQIGFGDVANAVALTRRFLREGFSRLKVRVGASDDAMDLARLRAIRVEAGPEVSIVADANSGWSTEQALRVLPELKSLKVKWLEQPVPNITGLEMLTAQNLVPIRADESARDAESVSQLGRAHAVNGVHLKLEKVGTVGHLVEAMDAARRAGLSVAFGQMDQGRLGCAATTHVAAGLGISEAELWGCAEVTDDIAGPLVIERGAVQLPQRPGLGVDVALSGAPKGRL